MAIEDKIDFGIITAPRDLPTLDFSIRSLRKHIPDCYLNIFSEPGRLEVDAYKMNILVNREKLGALHNYNNALNWILKFGKKPYIWITGHDYVDLAPGVIKAVDEFIKVTGYKIEYMSEDGCPSYYIINNK